MAGEVEGVCICINNTVAVMKQRHSRLTLVPPTKQHCHQVSTHFTDLGTRSGTRKGRQNTFFGFLASALQTKRPINNFKSEPFQVWHSSIWKVSNVRNATGLPRPLRPPHVTSNIGSRTALWAHLSNLMSTRNQLYASLTRGPQNIAILLSATTGGLKKLTLAFAWWGLFLRMWR